MELMETLDALNRRVPPPAKEFTVRVRYEYAGEWGPITFDADERIGLPASIPAFKK